MDKKDNPFVSTVDPELHRIFDSLVALKARTAESLAKADRIAGLGENPSFKPLAEIKHNFVNYRTLRAGSSSSWYSSKPSLESIDKQVQADIKIFEEMIAAAEIENAPLIAHNTAIKKQITDLMTRVGISGSYTTYEYPSTRSRTKKSISHTAGYLLDLNRVCPTDTVPGAKYRLREYISEYERWRKSEEAAEEKELIERDELAVQKNILGNPKLVATLMQADVNILEEVQRARPGKKAQVIEYCLAQAISNVNNQVNPDADLISKLEKLAGNV